MKSNRPYLVIGVLILAGVSLIEAAEKAPSPTPTPSGTAAPPRDAAQERFEGYVWLDVEGRPLPFQTDAAIEKFLAEANVESMKKIDIGVTLPRKVLLAGGGVLVHAAFKDVDETKKNITEPTAGKTRLYREWRDSHLYDVAAYHLDRLLGLDRVPPAVPRTIRHTEGTLIIWLEGTITWTRRRDIGVDPPDQLRWDQQRQIQHLFDNLVANRDSNRGNTLIDSNWRLWAIDCSRCFGTSKKLLYPEAITHCERGFWQTLKNLDETEVRRRLDPYLTGYEINALLARRDNLVQYLQERIDEMGEEHVLFDLRPPSKRATWAQE